MLVGGSDHCRSNGTLDPSRRSVMTILALGLSICRKRVASKEDAAVRLLAMRIIEEARTGVHDRALLKAARSRA
jgi:hypothetical protein